MNSSGPATVAEAAVPRTAAPPGDPEDPEDLKARVAGSPWLEAGALLLAPVVAFYGLHVVRMVRATMVDPYFYSAYAQNGPDLIARYGPDYYYWVRLGFILPARGFYLAFGAVPGFYAFRYVLALLAVVPAYLLFRRLHGRAAGALAVVVALSSPVVLYAWGTDYPDSSATSYLFAGTACLVMPAASRRRRLVWVTLAGIALTLAVHSQIIAAPLVAAVVLAYAAVNLRRAPLQVLAHLGLLALCAAAVTGVLALLASWVFGTSDIFGPTMSIIERTRSAKLISTYHTPASQWLPYFPYLAVPVVMAAGWAIARLGARGSLSTAEVTVAGAAGLQVLVYAWLQFFADGWTLEYHLYSSMLWPGVCLVTAFLLVAVCAPLLGRPATAALPAALAFLLPLAVSPFHPSPRFDMVPAGVLVVAGLLAAVVIARLIPQRAIAAVAVVLVIAGGFILTIDKPSGKANIYPPRAGYAGVIGGDGRAEVDRYAVASELHLVVPPARFPGDDLLLWHPAYQLNQPSAQYRWKPNSLESIMPELSRPSAKMLRHRRPRLLLLLSVTGREFPAAVRALAAASFEPSVIRRAVLEAGTQRLSVWVVELGSFAPPEATTGGRLLR